MKKILWTIQDEAAFEVFEKTGVLRADPNHLLFDGDFQDAYQWMADQMRHRIGAAPEGVQYPVWAWYQWEGQRKRMDLRRSGYAKRGTPLVQITFEADPRNSCFLILMHGTSCRTNTILQIANQTGMSFTQMTAIREKRRSLHPGIRFSIRTMMY